MNSVSPDTAHSRSDALAPCPRCAELSERVSVLESQLKTQAASTRALVKECDRLMDLRLRNELVGGGR